MPFSPELNKRCLPMTSHDPSVEERIRFWVLRRLPDEGRTLE